MKTEDKKAALAAYKESKTVAGIYGVTCAATGQRWVGYAGDLEKIQNRLWFTLRGGSNPHRSLQAAWNAHGADSFALEDLDRLDDDTPDNVRDRGARDLVKLWAEKLGAEAI